MRLEKSEQVLTNTLYMSSDLEDFSEQINELLESIRQVIERDVPKLKGQERVEVLKLG